MAFSPLCAFFGHRLVNARHVKNVPGRKTDVQDCQWLQYLHSVGLLHASFRPPATVCAVRALVRHRDSLVRTGCEHLRRVQKALDQMNVQVHRAVTDITGETGLAILEAIIKGERNPEVLAQHRHYRCKKSEAEIVAALRGEWRPEHLCTLRQSFEAWQYHQKLIVECETELHKQMDGLADQTKETAPPKPRSDCAPTIARPADATSSCPPERLPTGFRQRCGWRHNRCTRSNRRQVTFPANKSQTRRPRCQNRRGAQVGARSVCDD